MTSFTGTKTLAAGLAFALLATVSALPTPAITAENPPGYRYGDAKLATSPVSLADLDLLKQALLFTDEDAAALRQAGDILVPQTEAILDVWYGFVGSHPHLLNYFSNKQTGAPDGQYLARVRARFGKWIADTTAADYGQAWLDWQHEIGLRHHVSGKNRTDGAASVDQIHLRYIIAFIVPISATIKPFLENGDASAEEVGRMHAAWTKAVTLQAILWSHPYIKDGQF